MPDEMPTTKNSHRLPGVFILNYDHLGAILWGQESLAACLEEQCRRLRKYPRLHIGWDFDAYTFDYLANAHPELLQRMQAAVREFPTRLDVACCTYSQPLSRFISGESNIRQLLAAADTVTRHFGVRPRVYLTSEHAFHAQLPQILAHCGYTGVVFRTHFLMYGYNPEIDAAVVTWHGADGTSLPAVPTYVGQQTTPAVPGEPPPFGNVTRDNRILTDFARELQDSLEAFRAEFGARIDPLVASRADDPRQPEEIIAWHHDDPSYEWVSAEQLFARLPFPRRDFRPQAGEFIVRMPWGYCGNRIWQRERRCEALLFAAERAATLAASLEPSPSGDQRTQRVESAWRDFLVTQHHDLQILGLERAAESYFRAAEGVANEVLKSAIEHVASRVGNRPVPRTVIFNPLSWPRTAIVDVDGQPTLVHNIPGLGFAAVEATTRRDPAASAEFSWDALTRTLQTPIYQVQFHESGGLAQLTRCSDARRLLQHGVRSGILIGTINGAVAESQGQLVGQGTPGTPTSVRITEHGHVGSLPYTMVWEFYGHTPRIDWECKLHVADEWLGELSQDEHDAYSAFRHDRKIRLQWSLPGDDELQGWEHHPFLVAPNPADMLQGVYWSAVASDEGGIACFNGGNMGLLRETAHRISIPLAFSMHYIWNTVRMRGAYHYRISLLPLSSGWDSASVHRQALEAQFPVATCRTDRLHDPLGDRWAPLQIDHPDCFATALFRHHGQTYLRLWACRTTELQTSLRWHDRVPLLQEVRCDLSELGQNAHPLRFSAWQVKTLRLGLTTASHHYPSQVTRAFPDPPAGDWRKSRWLAEQLEPP
jgi:hypothetical protein